MCARGRAIAEPRLSPDGSRVAFLATAGGRAHLVVVPADGGAEVVVTSDPPPAPSRSYGGGAFDWAPDGASLVYAGGDGGLWLVAVDGGPSRCIVDGGAVSSPAVSPEGDRVAYVLDQHHVGVVPLADGGGWPVRVSGTADFCLDPTWSPDGRRVAWHEWDVPNMAWDESRIAVAPADGSSPATTLAGGDGVAVSQPRFAPHGGAVGYLCDADGWLNLWVADPDGGSARRLVDDDHEHGDPTWGAGQRSWCWSPDGSSVVHARNEGGFNGLHVVEVATGRSTPVSRGIHGGLSWVGDRLVCERSGARTPGTIVALDVAAPAPDGRAARTLLARGPVAGFEAADLAEPVVVDWQAEDGATVHGRLYRPAQPALEPPPLLVWIHGGPTSQKPVSFDARLAYFLDRGWAILVPDHRGSTGWGRAYTQAMAGRWGDLDVADTAAGMRVAGERGWGDQRRMVPIGGSAGGFTVLNLLAHHPDLCAAGVDLYGVTDLLDLDETTHRFEKHYLHSIVGPLPESAHRYRSRSPVSVADRITSPLLILQGLDDKVVPPAQSEAIAERLRALGRTVELHCYEGEGHGWGRPDTVIDELERTESFLRRHVLRWRG